MTWNEFEKQIGPEWFYTNRKLTNIECPKCGKYIYMRTDIVLTSHPAQYQYECDCGWVGYAHAKYA